MVELALDATVVGQVPYQRVVQRFPRPRQYVRIVARHHQMQLCVAAARGIAVEVSCLAFTKERLERMRAPASQRLGDTLCSLLVRSVGIVKVALQVPSEFRPEPQIGLPKHLRQRIG